MLQVRKGYNTIENIKSMYEDCRFIAMYEVADPDPIYIYVVDCANKILALYDSVWSDDFETIEYAISHFYSYFGRNMDEVAKEVVDGGISFKYL